MSALTLRPRSASEIADAAINLYRANGRLLLVVSATLTLPSLILMVLFLPSATDISTGSNVLRAVLLILSSLWSGVISGALTHAASERYLGREVTANGAIAAAWSRKFSLAFGLIARWMLVAFGAVLLIVPGIYAFIFSFAMIPAIMIEKRGINAAWLRSRALVRGMKQHVSGALVIGYLVFFVVFLTVGYMLGGMIFGANERALTVTQTAVQIFVSPFVVCTEMLLFYDLKIRKEGFDIEHMAASIESLEPAGR